MSEHTYNESDTTLEAGLSKAHENGDRTDILIVGLSESHYAVIGLDTHPADYEDLAAEVIDVLPSRQGAVTRAEGYAGENPKGVDPDHDKGRVRKLLTGGGGK